ncbi:MAG: hypothetical protein BZY82_00210 [SAR202 cluster bacterium Io17-Chloro-G3]|nr:MAG: hypothetical protein BZY82_00210 [SAR202 cluster bacterium Io17-Chloro-G3]
MKEPKPTLLWTLTPHFYSLPFMLIGYGLMLLIGVAVMASWELVASLTDATPVKEWVDAHWIGYRNTALFFGSFFSVSIAYRVGLSSELGNDG